MDPTSKDELNPEKSQRLAALEQDKKAKLDPNAKVSSSQIKKEHNDKEKSETQVNDEGSSNQNFGDSTIKTISDLPPEVLALVFERLGVIDRIRVEGVSKSTEWKKAVSLSWSNFKHLDLGQYGEVPGYPFDLYKAIISRCGKYLRSVSLQAMREQSKYEGLFKMMPKLQHLDLGYCNAGAQVLGEIAKCFPNLRSLKFDQISRERRSNLSNDTLQRFFVESCKSIEYLGVSLFHEPGLQSALLTASQKLPKFKVLDIYACYLDYNNSNADPATQIVANAATNNENLFALILRGGIDGMIRNPNPNLKNIKFLHVSPGFWADSDDDDDPYPGTREYYRWLMVSFSDLRGFSTQSYFKHVELDFLLKKCPKLEYLRFRYDGGKLRFGAVNQCFGSLRSLSIECDSCCSPATTKPAKTVLSDLIQLMVNKDTLEYFECRGSGIIFDIDDICDLVRHFKKLKTIAVQISSGNDLKVLFRLLDEIHKDTRPVSSDEILQLYLYQRPGAGLKKIRKLTHPWVKIFYDHKFPPRNKVIREIFARSMEDSPEFLFKTLRDFY